MDARIVVLALLSRNKGPIAEAEARRTEAAARFLALQAKTIGEIESAPPRPAGPRRKPRRRGYVGIQKYEASTGVRYEMGDISKLEWSE